MGKKRAMTRRRGNDCGLMFVRVLLGPWRIAGLVKMSGEHALRCMNLTVLADWSFVGGWMDG